MQVSSSNFSTGLSAYRYGLGIDAPQNGASPTAHASPVNTTPRPALDPVRAYQAAPASLGKQALKENFALLRSFMEGELTTIRREVFAALSKSIGRELDPNKSLTKQTDTADRMRMDGAMRRHLHRTDLAQAHLSIALKGLTPHAAFDRVTEENRNWSEAQLIDFQIERMADGRLASMAKAKEFFRSSPSMEIAKEASIAKALQGIEPDAQDAAREAAEAAWDKRLAAFNPSSAESRAAMREVLIAETRARLESGELRIEVAKRTATIQNHTMMPSERADPMAESGPEMRVILFHQEGKWSENEEEFFARFFKEMTPEQKARRQVMIDRLKEPKVQEMLQRTAPRLSETEALKQAEAHEAHQKWVRERVARL